ncbi:cationic amino acid transporter 2 isoform X1 [Bombyx mori]|uniref:Cationic amino acid transporter C-terminal domain-containing protein n=1 Tax=Bombyx mori TaxID=7091 RepID=A0A8R1WGA4_BOMMO|nr:cationic amino acid transporter 2 isoform X1 [Bombyx mori]
MSYPDENIGRNYESIHGFGDRDSSVRRSFENGGIKAGATHAARLAYQVLSRRKVAEEGAARLARVLTAFDLTALGVGSTLGVGVYVLAGDVAKNYAGPAVVISFLLAAVASVFAGLCYAEFGARVPKAGSAYVYSYVCVGEFIAFIIGWNLILEYIIGAASVVKALSEYLDSLLNKAISSHLEAALPIDSPHLADYPDVFAFSVIMAFSVALSFGVKESTKFNNVCTAINLCVVLFVIVSGSLKADTSNWRIPESEVPKDEGRSYGTGGFAPYGLAGIIRGAAVCFYGFIGFDCVATAGEEARRPQRSIPAAVAGSLLVVFLAYCGVSCVLTLVLPYYLQDEKAPFPFVYDRLGWPWAKYAVSVGAICALCSSLMGAVFPLPRIIYAMASDGLLFRWLGRVNEKYQTPLVGTITAGFLTGTLAMIFKLEQLIHMMSIGTLLAYSMVASCVLLLRYEASPQRAGAERAAPSRRTATTVTVLVTLYGIWCFLMMWCVNSYGDRVLEGHGGYTALLLLATALVVATLCCISRQPVSEKKLAFSVPLVPWLPGLSILINVYLMLNLDYMTWVRFGVWIVAGLVIYFSYGMWNSTERRRTMDSIQLADQIIDGHTALLNHSGLTHALG